MFTKHKGVKMHDYYRPKYFDVVEFVPKFVVDALGDEALIVMDYRILKTADALVNFFNRKPVINNWDQGGRFSMRGYRPAWQFKGIARFNPHNFGRAIDFTIDGVSAEHIRYSILKNQYLFPYITAMQAEVPWVHIDCRAIVSGGIYVFNSDKEQV
jgi:hypothetical protein